MSTSADKRRTFRQFARERLLRNVPNPWDIGSTLYLQSLGFKALATTSAGFAWTRGLDDGGITRDMAIAHIAELSAKADVPFNADFEGGFAHEPAGVAESVRLACETDVAGLSIEDFTGNIGQSAL